VATERSSIADRFDSYTKSAGLAIGLISAAITAYVAIVTYRINQQLLSFQVQNAERDKSIKDAQILRDQMENSVRLGYELGVSNAKAFALDYGQQKSRFEWVDATLRRDMEQYVEPWSSGRRLMTGTRESGVFLRQVVWIRVANMGKRPAEDVQVHALVKDFDNQNGQSAVPIDKLKANVREWREQVYKLPALMEASGPAPSMRTSAAFPLMHVSGSTQFYGRVVLPTKITWRNAASGTTHTIDIDLEKETLLLNSVGSAVLGRMR